MTTPTSVSDSSLWRPMRQDLVTLLWVFMECALVVPFFYALMPWSRYWPPLLFFVFAVCFMLVPFNLARLMTVFDLPLRFQYRFFFIFTFIIIGLSMRILLYDPVSLFDFRWLRWFIANITAAGYPYWARDFGVIGLVLYLWWRGLRLTSRQIDLDAVGLQFRLRALLLFPLLLALSWRRVVFDVTPFILLFGLSGLLVISLSRADETEQNATGLSFSLTPSWVGMLGLASLAVVLFSGLLALIVGADEVSGGPQTAFLFALYSVILTLVNLLAPYVFPLLEWLTAFLVILLEPLAQLIASVEFFGLVSEESQEEVIAEVDTVLPEQLRQLTSLIPALIVVGLIILIVVIIVLSFQQLRMRDEAEEGVSVDLDPADLDRPDRPGLLDRLRGLIPGLRDWRTARSIRRLYRQMVYVATNDGHPRLRAETPYEYLPKLEHVWPEGNTETTLITDAYVRVRYGELPETTAELQEIIDAWSRLEKQLLERQ